MRAWTTAASSPWLRAITALLALAAMQGCGPGSGSSSEDNLIGGTKAKPLEFPSTLYLPNGCTAALVGPRQILTAAHCVLDPATLRPKTPYATGASVSLLRDPSIQPTVVQVAKAEVSPSWTLACSKTYCGPSEVTGKLDAADVAVIVTADDVPDIPVAPVDATTVEVGDTITVVGFGCEDGVLTHSVRPEKTLAYAETVVISAESAVHDGSFLTEDGVATAAASYFMSPGPALDESAPGLCPGDSGGPVYKARDDANVVVGVNANYTLLPEDVDSIGLPVTNWHTRLDDASRFDIASWLESLGAVMAE